jgi:pectinesterase
MRTGLMAWTIGVGVLLGIAAGCTSMQSAVKPPVIVKPDITVAADGSGDFKTVQEALNSIPRDNKQRMIVLIKDGTYKERVNINAPFVTLRGQSRKGARIEFATSDTGQGPGGSVLNINGSDCILENLSVVNTYNVVGPHEMAVYGRQCDRTVIVDCDILSEGADTLSLWQGDAGRYYHARLNIRGAVDFVCPRGWCYMTDCTLYETKSGSAAMWHDGSKNQDQKFVMRNCKFDGVENWELARHHHDAWFYFLDCTFSKTLKDRAPYRVIYPLNGGTPTEADIQRNKAADPTNIWGDRTYYHNTHRDGGDYSWITENLAKSPGAPTPEQITAKWTFAGTWDPEDKTGPRISAIDFKDGQARVKFTESVTVRGKPILKTAAGAAAVYAGGSGSDTLVFAADNVGTPASIDLNGGMIFATQASVNARMADLSVPN